MTLSKIIQPARTPVGAALETSGPVGRAGVGAVCVQMRGRRIGASTPVRGEQGAAHGRLIFGMPYRYLQSILLPNSGGGFGLRLFSRLQSIAASLAAMGKRVSALLLLGAAPRIFLRILAQFGHHVLPDNFTQFAHRQTVLSSVAGFDESHTSEGILRVVQKQSGAFPNVTGS